MANDVSFGRDTWCVDSLKPGRIATGVQLVAQRCYHRLITPKGTLRGGEDEANFGEDLAGFIGRTDASDVDSMLPVMVRNELLQDPMVDEVSVEVARVEGGGQVSWTLTIRVTSSSGTFDLLVSASEITLELLGVS